MFPYIICTDSGSDLPEDYIAQQEIGYFPLTYMINGKTYGSNGENLPFHEFYDYMRAGNVPKTSQVNPEEAKEGLKKLLEKNKNILVLALSSGISGTYNSFRIAAEELNEEESDSNIIVIDSLAASLGEGLYVYFACLNREKGMSIEENAKWLTDNRLKFTHVFTVDDLNHLYRGGRVSRGTAIIGTVLSIKPVLHVDDEGKLIPLKNVRSRKKALMTLVDLMEEKMGSYKEKSDVFFISHGDCEEEANIVKEEINRRFGMKTCIINHIGPLIGAHSGPGTVALFFLGDER